MSLQGAIARRVAAFGAVYTLRTAAPGAGVNAWTAGAATPAYYPCLARERRYKPNEIKGGIVEGDILVTVDAASLAVAPVNGNQIALGRFTGDAGAKWVHVVNVYAPSVGGVPVAYKLQVRR